MVAKVIKKNPNLKSIGYGIKANLPKEISSIFNNNLLSLKKLKKLKLKHFEF